MKWTLRMVIAMAMTLSAIAPAIAAIPPTRFIVSELVQNSGGGIYQIEQDVQFATAGEPLVLRETWWVENENTMRLEVRALRELKDQFRLSYVYQGGQRTGLTASGKVAKKMTADLIERYFHFRSTDRLMNELAQMQVFSSINLSRKPLRSLKELDLTKGEPNVRLSRAGGAIAYAFGTPSPEEGTPNPGFWIEQDTFILRKFRLPSGVEVSADRFTQSPRGLLFPRARTVRWGAHTIQIQTLNVSAKSGLKSDFFQPSSLTTANRPDGIQNPTLKETVDEFYMRFR